LTEQRHSRSGLHRIYYNTDLSGGSSDPADPSITARVLTIATTAEY